MIKRLIGLLLICVLLLAIGWVLYRRLAHPIPPDTSAVSHWPSLGSGVAEDSTHGPGRTAARPRAAGEPANKKESIGTEVGFLLRQGEVLQYDANVTKLNSTIAKLKIVALEKRNSAGRSSWHLQASAHTESPYRMVFELDDQFDSYSDAANMTSLQYEMHLSERGEKVDSVQRLLPSVADSVPQGISAARVLPGTRDPLGFLEYLRGVDWSRAVEVRSPVYDGRKLYDVRAALVGKDASVNVPAGSFKAMKIEIHVLDNGTEMKDAHFMLYLTMDAAKLPVLMEAVLPAATAHVELTEAK